MTTGSPNSSTGPDRPIGRHMRIWGNLQKRMWGYAAGEITITTVGILIALAANSWWERHRDRQDEVGLLREMRRELVADTADMNDDEFAYRIVLGAARTLRQRFSTASAYTPELDSLFGVQVLFRHHISSASAWQTLQGRGVGLVADDSLRLRIMAYYEAGNRLILEWNRADTYIVDNTVRPYYRKHFTHNALHGPHARTRPLNYGDVARDPEFAYILAEREDAVISTLNAYRTTQTDAVWLMQRIDLRLGKLD